VPIASSGLPRRYRSPDEDSARWQGFAFRQGDIVISARSKSGTTWMQMISALLVFKTPDLPEPLAKLSPWLDWLAVPLEEVLARLAAQAHRRVIKTHTPLDGVPIDERATYLVVARHPLDMAVSLYHQGGNLDRARIQQLTGQPVAPVPETRPALVEWMRSWITWEGDPTDRLDSLPGVFHHLSDAWARRNEPNVVLVHYDDLSADLDGTMRSIAARLGITAPEATWAQLVDAAGFDRMRDRAPFLVPDPVGVLKDAEAFFRRGTSGAGREALTAAQLREYRERVEHLAPPDLVAWLHRDVPGSG